ncbi:MAG: bacterial transcriptional activator domain-containing protein, partial [Sulfobacillus sp.]
VEIEKLTAALSLVRGMPFEGVADGTYGWATTEMIVSDIEYGVLDAARRLARLALGCGDHDRARWAAEKGLVVSPYDRDLWSLLLEVAAVRGPGEVERTYERARATLGEDVSELDAVMASLRQP